MKKCLSLVFNSVLIISWKNVCHYFLQCNITKGEMCQSSSHCEDKFWEKFIISQKMPKIVDVFSHQKKENGEIWNDKQKKTFEFFIFLIYFIYFNGFYHLNHSGIGLISVFLVLKIFCHKRSWKTEWSLESMLFADKFVFQNSV